MNKLNTWEIYDLSAYYAATVTIWSSDGIGLSVKKQRNDILKFNILDVPIWDCQSLHLKHNISPSYVWENVIKPMKNVDVIGISIKSPVMKDLFEEYFHFFSEKAGYIRWISPRILRVDRDIDDIWRKNLDKKARNAVRRAEKSGVRIEIIDPEDYIEEIYECNKSKKGVPPCYVDKDCITNEIKNNKNNFGDCFQGIGAFLREKLIGYAYLISVNRELTLLSRLFINYNFRHVSISELLLWSGIEITAKNKMKFLQYGSWSRYHPGLDMLLEHFGFSKSFKTLNIYIPLTRRGKIFLVQKKAVNRIIQSEVLVKLSQSKILRDRWYVFKSLRKKFT
jgi:hypothetical protein